MIFCILSANKIFFIEGLPAIELCRVTRFPQYIFMLKGRQEVPSTMRVQTGSGMQTMASVLAERIRVDIIRGSLAPGERLKIQDLTRRYGAGSIPMREALSRLANSGFVEAKDQRGFFVKAVSMPELLDLTRVRLLIEPAALRDSILYGDGAWEERVLSTHHRMSRQSIFADKSRGELNPDWEAAHDDFHKQLISACPSPWLLQFANTLRDQTTRYRHITVASQRTSTRDVTGEHEAICEAALAKKADLAVGLICEHMKVTASIALEEKSAVDALSAVGSMPRPRSHSDSAAKLTPPASAGSG